MKVRVQLVRIYIYIYIYMCVCVCVRVCVCVCVITLNKQLHAEDIAAIEGSERKTLRPRTLCWKEEIKDKSINESYLIV